MIVTMSGSQSKTETNIWQELESWSEELQRWQKFVVHQAVASKRLTDEELELAYQLMLAENDLGEEPEPPVSIPTSITGRPHGDSTVLRLARIEGTKNVNAIPDGTSLRFGPGLTVVYGGNAAGKSGFFRVLAAACFSRSRIEILPDVYSEDAGSKKSSAEVVLVDGDGTEETYTYPEEESASALKRFSVFDATIAEVHVDAENEFYFRPTGFDVFSEMVRAHKYCINKIETEISSKRTPNKFDKLVVTEHPTPISEVLDSLDEDTDLDEIEALGTFGATEKACLKSTGDELSKLRATSVKHIVEDTKQAQDDLKVLISKIADAGLPFSPERYRDYQKAIAEYRRLLKVAKSENIESLKDADLKGVGSEKWEQFTSAAYELAKEQNDDYPKPGEKCLLCHTPVNNSAHAIIHDTWQYLKGEARKKARRKRKELNAAAETIRDLELDLLPEESRIRTYLESTAPELSEDVEQCLKSLKDARDTVCEGLEKGVAIEVEPVDVAVLEDLRVLKDTLTKKLQDLKSQSKEEAIRALAHEYRTLRHKEVLAKNVDEVLDYVRGLKWAKKATQVRHSVLPTTSITNKESELSGELIAQDYVEQFSKELEKLKCPEIVVPQMKGRKGRTVRTLEIPAEHRPAEVLSEGEKKAVAVADFLTEVGLNPDSAGIVLDDPVTSLDNYRKKDIAIRLVHESQERQVIVFTHDLEFLVLLCEACKRTGVDPTTHWVQTDADGTPGIVVDNEGPLTSRTYKNAEFAKEKLKEAGTVKGNERIALIRRTCEAIRTCLERLVLDQVLQDVVSPYRRHVKMGAMQRVMWSNEVVSEIVETFEDVSNYIHAHCRPDGAEGSAPRIEDAKRFIERYEELRKKVREVNKGNPPEGNH